MRLVGDVLGISSKKKGRKKMNSDAKQKHLTQTQEVEAIVSIGDNDNCEKTNLVNAGKIFDLLGFPQNAEQIDLSKVMLRAPEKQKKRKVGVQHVF